MCDHFPLALASSVMLYTEQSFHERWLRARLQQQSTRGATDEALSQDQGHRTEVVLHGWSGRHREGFPEEQVPMPCLEREEG